MTRERLTSGITDYTNPTVCTLVLGKICVDPLNFLVISLYKVRSVGKQFLPSVAGVIPACSSEVCQRRGHLF